MKKLYDDSFVEALRKKILDGDFKNKEELIEYLKKIDKEVINDPIIMERLKQEGILVNSEDLNEISKELLILYDKSKEDVTSLNLDGVSQFEIEGTDYIKIRNENGTYEVLDDSMNDKDFVKQMQERQNKSVSLQTNDGIKNKEEIIKEMKEDKSEAKLTSSNNVNIRELTPEERRQFMAVMRMNDADEINFVVDPVRNIYINKDTGETYYVNKNQFNQMEVRKVEEKTVETIKENKEVIDDVGKDVETTVESSGQFNFEELDQYELQFTVDNKWDSLTPEQQEKLLAVIEKRKNAHTISEEEKSMVKEEKPKTYVKSMLNQKYNGFTSIALLSLITMLYGVLMLAYISFKITI